MEGHRLANDPANNDEERSHQKGDLNAGANGHTHSKVHLVANSNDNSCHMLRRVADNWDQNQTDEGLADASCLDNVVDASNQVIGTDGDQNSGDNEDGGGSNGAQDGLLLLVSLGGSLDGGGLGIEQVAVGAKLEDEVEDVEQEKDDGGATGQDEDAVRLVFGAVLVEDRVEL